MVTAAGWGGGVGGGSGVGGAGGGAGVAVRAWWRRVVAQHRCTAIDHGPLIMST